MCALVDVCKCMHSIQRKSDSELLTYADIVLHTANTIYNSIIIHAWLYGVHITCVVFMYGAAIFSCYFYMAVKNTRAHTHTPTAMMHDMSAPVYVHIHVCLFVYVWVESVRI